MILIPSAPPAMPVGPDGTRRRVALLATAGTAADTAQLTAQARALATALPGGWVVATVVRDGPAAVRDAVLDLVRHGADELVVIPMHPQFTPSGTGVIVRELYDALAHRAPTLNVAVRTTWYDDAGYVNALSQWVAEAVARRELDPLRTRLRFTVDGSTGGDAAHLRGTGERVVEQLGWPRDGWSIVWPDTKEAPVTGPDALECPLPFPIGVSAPSKPMVDALRGLVLHGAQPATGGRAPRPMLQVRSNARGTDIAPLSLLLVGASLANGIGPGRGPDVRYSDARAFACVKRSRKALRECLAWIRDHTPLAEAFVWNTCQRVELYGWLPSELDQPEHARLIATLRQAVLGTEPDGLEVNVLWDDAARHHLLRTVCGLNSGLPGDRDVAAQLQTSLRTAQCSRTAGPRATALVDRALALAREAHADPGWSRFSTGFCAAALARICEVDGLCPDRFEHVVIGGSTTSRSILTTLVEEHGVPHRQLTLIYRDHHGQMKQLRAALGMGRRLRVHAYGDDAVLRAIAAADVVYFGIDQAEPVLDASVLRSLRAGAPRPLTLVDFNSFGSIACPGELGDVTLWSAKELDEAVAAHAAVTMTRSGFAEALAGIEDRILEKLATAGAVLDPGATPRAAG